MIWRLVLTERARRDLGHLDKMVAARVTSALERLAGEGGGDVKRLRGEETWRLRVGSWRVRFTFDYESRTIQVLRVLPRGSGYRR